MKRFISTLTLAFLAIPSFAQQDINWYSFGGLSLYNEDIDAAVGDGIGANVGLGLQFNETVGLEFFIDRAPAIDPETLWNAFAKEFDDIDPNEDGYDIKIAGNLSFTVAGTLTFPINEKLAGIVKGGYSQTSFNLKRFEVTIDEGGFFYGVWIPDVNTYDVRELFEDDDNGFFLSGGLLLTLNEKNQFEFSISQISLDEGKSFSINGSFRYKF